MNAQQLQNLKELRALGARILAEPERYPLDLNNWSCGAPVCWLGWYWRETGTSAGEAMEYEWAHQHFGLEHPLQFLGLNQGNNDHYVELGARLERLNTFIAQHEPQPKGIPSSVRALFDVETA